MELVAQTEQLRDAPGQSRGINGAAQVQVNLDEIGLLSNIHVELVYFREFLGPLNKVCACLDPLRHWNIYSFLFHTAPKFSE